MGKKSKTYKTYYKDGKQVGDRIQIYADTYPRSGRATSSAGRRYPRPADQGYADAGQDARTGEPIRFGYHPAEP